MPGTLHICRGLPASGKSTLAKEWVKEDTDRVRLNRDDLRASLHGGYIGQEGEKRVTQLQQTMALMYLKANISVITDDTNLNAGFVKEWLKTAAKAESEVVWHDEFLDVPLATLLERDASREARVGEKVIKDFYGRYMQGGRRPKRPELPAAVVATAARYEGTPGKPETVLVDLDGTVALNGTDRANPNRGWFDWDRVGEDLPNKKVIDLVWRLAATGITILFVSGRTDEGRCRELTEKWIERHMPGLPHAGLIMRETDCGRKDSIVKLELFDNYIRDNYNVIFCLDDRDQVVEAYRSIGLTVLQVSEGAF